MMNNDLFLSHPQSLWLLLLAILRSSSYTHGGDFYRKGFSCTIAFIMRIDLSKPVIWLMVDFVDGAAVSFICSKCLEYVDS